MPFYESDIRPLGRSGIHVTSVALGCWPMAGVTTLDTNHADSIATVHAAIDAGVNHFDTAYVYGPNGESDAVLRDALADRNRKDFVIASKGGVHYEADEMTQDARPDTLRRECDEALGRVGTDYFDLYYLHSPDPNVPVAESARAIADLIQAGKVRSAGASNCSLDQVKEFDKACPLSAVQLPYNMLQRGIEQESIPWCQENEVAVVTYWPLMKGLLAGKLPPDGKLPEGDSRRNYPMYQGEEWERNQQFVGDLREIAERLGKSVAELTINWTLSQGGITSVLCGAKRPWQIKETAAAMGWRLDEGSREAIKAALERRGEAETKRDFK